MTSEVLHNKASRYHTVMRRKSREFSGRPTVSKGNGKVAAAHDLARGISQVSLLEPHGQTETGKPSHRHMPGEQVWLPEVHEQWGNLRAQGKIPMAHHLLSASSQSPRADHIRPAPQHDSNGHLPRASASWTRTRRRWSS